MATNIEPTYPLTILVELDEDGVQSRDDLQAVVDEVLIEDAHGARWGVRRFFERPDLVPTAQGFYEVRGHVPVSPSTSIRALGFELAAALAEQLTGALAGVAMPDFPSNAYGRVEAVEDAGSPPAAAPGPEDLAAQLAWPLVTMRCGEAWTLEPPRPEGRRRGEGIVIGHPDSGYTYHRELMASLDRQRDFDVIDGDTDAEDPMTKRWWWPWDSPGHGTSTGSVIVSTEADGITGAAPAATLVPMRAVRSVVQVSDGDVAKAIDRSVSAGAHVISMSLGGVGFYSGIRAAVQRARASGVIVMAAAGNRVPFVVAPARFAECIAVAATDRHDQPWDGSSRGDEVLVSAPGHDVPVADAKKGSTPGQPATATGTSSGTSYAVAHLAGVAALWLAHHGRDFLIGHYGRPSALHEAFEVIVRTVGFTRPVPWDTRWGVGVVDAVKVLEAPLPDLALPDLALPDIDDQVEGAGVEAAAPPSDHVERLVSLNAFGAEPRAELRELLVCDDGELDEVVRVHGPELAYAIAEGELRPPGDQPASTPEAAADAATAPANLRRLLARQHGISDRLRARIEQR